MLTFSPNVSDQEKVKLLTEAMTKLESTDTKVLCPFEQRKCSECVINNSPRCPVYKEAFKYACFEKELNNLKHKETKPHE